MPDLASHPDPRVPVPPLMQEIAQGPVTLVWENMVGGLTGRVEGPEPRFVKWNPKPSHESLVHEAERMRWLEGRHPGPRVVALVDTPEAEVLVTAALPGLSAVDPRWAGDTDDAVRAIASGLRALHTLPVTDCPFTWDVASRIAQAEANGRSVPDELRTPPPIDRPVVCQGDPCAPNTLLDGQGRFLAHVDLARLGVADRWADLAVATMSLGWNFADVDEDLFWDTYGIRPDAARIAYYRALWDAT
ncbi:aminoglycoside 3'-phosphotransferase [Actinomyces provencensis]|uniref:aminoglycoside 3'-phosphotransferase n=1 Tax=Actinomyces provencensis TaxID=1720198 RepID=UPI001E4BD76A|nr:aminoglycoside 3'-phosphotransferase [Actinomyces provencensis]